MRLGPCGEIEQGLVAGLVLGLRPSVGGRPRLSFGRKERLRMRMVAAVEGRVPCEGPVDCLIRRSADKQRIACNLHACESIHCALKLGLGGAVALDCEKGGESMAQGVHEAWAAHSDRLLAIGGWPGIWRRKGSNDALNARAKSVGIVLVDCVGVVVPLRLLTQRHRAG